MKSSELIEFDLIQLVSHRLRSQQHSNLAMRDFLLMQKYCLDAYQHERNYHQKPALKIFGRHFQIIF